jgi:uncharacterized glyoxalase superfamily protein PhnB
MASKRIPEGYHTLTPHLSVRGAAQAIEFYKKAFGAQEIARHAGPGDLIMHAELQIGDSKVLLNDEFPNSCATSPQTLQGTPVALHLFVEDVDTAFQQAVDAGATVMMPLADQFWGDRYGIVTDPFGHRWSLASRIKEMTREEMTAAGTEAMANMA